MTVAWRSFWMSVVEQRSSIYNGVSDLAGAFAFCFILQASFATIKSGCNHSFNVEQRFLVCSRRARVSAITFGSTDSTLVDWAIMRLTSSMDGTMDPNFLMIG